ncbi:DoxX family membrane protein [Candidatus Peregrinibacteria bacterium]|nr:DoxX family membrane protein [Candidatus Peregrinibacteria bacterium]
MKHYSYHILRVGLGITFLWIGILILQNPALWFSSMLPWAQNAFGQFQHPIMYAVAGLDLLVGLLLLVDAFLWLVALIGIIHLITALVASGINATTVHDLALIAALMTIYLESKSNKYF